ncbi:MAG TPA: hypothetical protein VM406_08605 [Noviherbaspirillum sp.]|nr:hypothetical protein [Noviherbaspirillum sp.]
MNQSAVLDADSAAFLALGCSINAGAYGADRIPVTARCCGCNVTPDRTALTVFLSSRQGAAVVRAVRDNGAIAVVFSQPSTHRTLQIKGRDALVVLPEPEDLDRVARYRHAFGEELRACGYDPLLAHTILSHPPADIVGLRFSPSEVYLQTPGPKAGERLY